MGGGYGFPVLEEGPTRPRDPITQGQLEAMGNLGLSFGKSRRIEAINTIGMHLRVPLGGWTHGRSNLFEKGDIRLRGVLALMTDEAAARHLAVNLASAARYVDGNHLLTLVTAQREHASSLTAHSDALVDSFWEGGLDHLGDNKNQLGLPRDVTNGWRDIRPYYNPDAAPRPGKTLPKVHPAFIHARDQVLIYAAQINSSYSRAFRKYLVAALGSEANTTLARASRVGRLCWQALAFLAPGGNEFDPKRALREQAQQHFGIQAALQYLVHRARVANSKGAVDLDQIFMDSELNVSAWIRSCKIRVVETLFLERLLTTVRELFLAED
jgi:hypothetical protein